MEESVITIKVRTGSSTKKLSLTLSSPYNINLEPGPGPTMTTLLLDFEDGSFAISGNTIDFQIVPVVPPEAPPSPLSPLNHSLNRLSLRTRHFGTARIGKQDVVDLNRSFDVSVKITSSQETIVVNVCPSDSVFVLRKKIKAIIQTCPPYLFYEDVAMDQNGASLGFYKIRPGAEIVGTRLPSSSEK